MIRVVLSTKYKLECGLESEEFSTIDIECPDLEERLTEGGFSQDTYHRTRAIALEVRPDTKVEGGEDE